MAWRFSPRSSQPGIELRMPISRVEPDLPYVITNTWRSSCTSPRLLERAALVEAGGGLDAHERTLAELREVGRTGVGAGRPDAGADLVDEVLDAGAVGVEVHPGGRDALFVEALAGAVVRRLLRRAVGDGAGRGHPERHLERAAVGVEHQVAGRLVGASEPGADHHRRGAGGQRERDVPRVAYASVGPHVLAELACGGGALPHRGELRPADAGHHPRGAHRA